MAVPTGTASMQDIEDEFGGTGSIALSEYYSANPNIPSSGTISIDDFRGESNYQTFTVTEGSIAKPASYGYSMIVGYGSRSPTTVYGETISAANWQSGGNFEFGIQATVTSTWMTQIVAQGIGTLTAASASFSASGGYSSWTWSGQPQGGWDGTGTRTVDVYQ